MTSINIGTHVSISKSIDLAVDRAKAFGNTSFQIFPGPPQTWLMPSFPKDKLMLFREKRRKQSMKNVFIHEIYLTNLASTNPVIYKKSVQSLIRSAKLGADIQADGVIFHPGSYPGENKQKGIKQIIKGVLEVYKAVAQAKIIFESSTGAGNKIGSKLEDLGELLNLTKSFDTSICLDTCHLFASGYKFGSKAEMNGFVSQIKTQFPLEKIKAIHLNGSYGVLGSNQDRHANIGEGELAVSWLKNFISNPEFKDKPFILETPKVKEQVIETSFNKPVKQSQNFISEVLKQLT